MIFESGNGSGELLFTDDFEGLAKMKKKEEEEEEKNHNTAMMVVVGGGGSSGSGDSEDAGGGLGSEDQDAFTAVRSTSKVKKRNVRPNTMLLPR